MRRGLPQEDHMEEAHKIGQSYHTPEHREKRQDNFAFLHERLINDPLRGEAVGGRYACRSRDSFYLSGWVPAEAVNAFQEKMSRFPNLSCVVDDAGDVEYLKPPT